jgi:hypothetical protein
MRLTDRLRLILLSVLWGGAVFFVGLAAAHLPHLALGLPRVAMAAGLLVLILAGTGTPSRGLRVWGALAVSGGWNTARSFAVFAVAPGQIDSGLPAIRNAISPLWAVGVAPVVTTDHLMTPCPWRDLVQNQQRSGGGGMG